MRIAEPQLMGDVHLRPSSGQQPKVARAVWLAIMPANHPNRRLME
jgi:hypothetical protein